MLAQLAGRLDEQLSMKSVKPERLPSKETQGATKIGGGNSFVPEAS